MEGQITPVGKAFTPQAVNYEKTYADGTVKEIHSEGWEISQWNDYGKIPNAHVNCHCYFDEVNFRRAN